MDGLRHLGIDPPVTGLATPVLSVLLAELAVAEDRSPDGSGDDELSILFEVARTAAS